MSENGKLQIVIGQRGWVWVGRVTVEGTEVVVEGARCVRRWGTTKGLAELAAEGPRPETKLDAPITLRLHAYGIVGRYDANEEAWRGR